MVKCLESSFTFLVENKKNHLIDDSHSLVDLMPVCGEKCYL